MNHLSLLADDEDCTRRVSQTHRHRKQLGYGEGHPQLNWFTVLSRMFLPLYLWDIFADCNRLGIWAFTVAGSPDSLRMAAKRAPPSLFETLTFQTG